MRTRTTQNDTVPQTILSQCSVYFGDADFGCAASIFQTGDLCRTRTAGITGNIDDVGTGLRHTDCNGSDAF